MCICLSFWSWYADASLHRGKRKLVVLKKKKKAPRWQESSKKLRKDNGGLRSGLQVVAMSVAVPATEACAASGLVLLVRGGRWHFPSGCTDAVGENSLSMGRTLLCWKMLHFFKLLWRVTSGCLLRSPLESKPPDVGLPGYCKQKLANSYIASATESIRNCSVANSCELFIYLPLYPLKDTVSEVTIFCLRLH